MRISDMFAPRPLTSHQEFEDVKQENWRKWTEEYAPNEQRFIALARIKQCNENFAANLDLSGLFLSSLPEYLPDSVEHLNVANNNLTQLPARLPICLKELSANNNQLKYLPEKLRKKIEYIDIKNNQLTQLPAILSSLVECIICKENNPLSVEVSNSIFNSRHTGYKYSGYNYSGYSYTRNGQTIFNPDNLISDGLISEKVLNWYSLEKQIEVISVWNKIK